MSNTYSHIYESSAPSMPLDTYSQSKLMQVMQFPAKKSMMDERTELR
jgi:hypothetical protein